MGGQRRVGPEDPTLVELGCQGEVKSCGMQKGFNRQPRGQQLPSNPNIIYLPGKGGLRGF